MTSNERIAWTVAAIGALVATGLGYLWGHAHASAAPMPTSTQVPASKQVLYWYDPMVPDQHFEKPGKSPFMDMQLVPKYADASAVAGVSIAPQLRQNLGMRTIVAERGHLPETLRVPGTVGWNLRDERIVSLPVDAVVSRLYVRTPFEKVRSGQALMSVRAPAWSSALAESAALRGASSADAGELRLAAGQRLRALGLPAGSVGDGQGGIVLAAPIDGVLGEIAVREGQAVSAGMPLLRINGTRSFWIEAALPPTAAAKASPGTAVEVVADARPGAVFAGHVEALLPQVDPGTRSQRARIVLDDPDSHLAPGMFVQVELKPEAQADAVLVPSEAIVSDGQHTRVIVQRGERFVPLEVRIGASGGGKTEVVSGLTAGERVVASGQFLIDSEANLSGALQRLDAESGR